MGQVTAECKTGHASVALVGLQGAGKRSLGFIAASYLHRRLVLECVHFEKATGFSKAAYLREYGREIFYSRVRQGLRDLLAVHANDAVIVCGVASLVPGAFDIIAGFAETHPVIKICRDSQNIKLENRSKEADRLHHLCSNLEFYNLDDTAASATSLDHGLAPFTLREVKADFENFLDFALGQNTESLGPFHLRAATLEGASFSSVLTLRMSEVLANSKLSEYSDSTEKVVELLIDQWSEDARGDLSRSVAKITRFIKTPILLSVDGLDRTLADPDWHVRMDALHHGIRLGVEYIILDSHCPEEHQTNLLRNKGSTRAILHHHRATTEKDGWLARERIQMCVVAAKLGFDLVRLTQTAVCEQDNDDIRDFLQRVSRTKGISIPVSAWNLGPLGKPSVISNRFLTPVQHMPVSNSRESDLSQELTIRDIVQGRFMSGEHEALNFWVFGAQVSSSLTPAFNTAAYEFYGMEHSFRGHCATTFAGVLPKTQDPHFGGAAIAAPLKEQAVSACMNLSPHASAIGAVNTVLPLRQFEPGRPMPLVEQAKRRNKAGSVVGLYGDNNDWAGISISILGKLSPMNAAALGQSVALVIGAGGSARSAIYALMRCRIHTICIYNRTHENALRLAGHFGRWGIESGHRTCMKVLGSADLVWPEELQHPSIIISCVPLGVMALPEAVLGNARGGVVADMCYTPRDTPLLEQVRRYRERTKRAWAIVEGLDILFENAVLLFEQLTGYKAPRHAMRHALLC